MDDFQILLLSLWQTVKLFAIGLTAKPAVIYIAALLIIFIAVSSRLRRKKGASSGRIGSKMYRKAAVNELKLFGDLSYQRLNLMSETEINFFIKLQMAFPGYFVFPQIGATALIDIKSRPFNRHHFFSALNWIDTARIDFTLCDPQGLIVALIELDDSSHDDKKDRDEARNYIYRSAGYRLFRFDCRRMPDAALIRETIINGSH
jgi:hypothetical protein